MSIVDYVMDVDSQSMRYVSFVGLSLVLLLSCQSLLYVDMYNSAYIIHQSLVISSRATCMNMRAMSMTSITTIIMLLISLMVMVMVMMPVHVNGAPRSSLLFFPSACASADALQNRTVHIYCLCSACTHSYVHEFLSVLVRINAECDDNDNDMI